MITLISLACFILELVHRVWLFPNDSTTKWIIRAVLCLTNGFLHQLLLTSVLEFLCAQTPYNMRGLLVSFALPVSIVSTVTGWNVGYAVTHKFCSQWWCLLVSLSVKTLVCFTAFVLFCIAARWYKLRVRDENYSPQRVVEEVYDRYLTAAAR